MHNIDTPNIPNNWEATALTSAESFENAKQDKLDAISKIDNPQLQKLAKAELQELETAEKLMNWEKLAIQKARTEFKNDIDALTSLEERFWALDNFSQFADFLNSSQLSTKELEVFYAKINAQIWEDDWEELISEFEFDGFPTTRESYIAFTNKFGIQTSMALNEEFDAKNKKLYLNSLPALRSLSNLPQIAELSKMIAELEWTCRVLFPHPYLV